MKNLYLLIALFILAACGPSEEEATSESEPVNVFEGTYIGDVLGSETSVSIKGSALFFGAEEPCEIEDPYSTPTGFTCVYDNGSSESYTIKVEGDTLTISPVDFPMELIFERVSE